MTSKEPRTLGEPAGEDRKDQGMLHMPRLPLPGMPMDKPAGTAGRVLWWGGLAALAAFDIVEWPVAVLVGAGTWVAEQYAKAAAQSQHTEQRQGT